jgi:hypothetical protein
LKKEGFKLNVQTIYTMEKETPEDFYKQIQDIQTKFNKDTENEDDTNYQMYYNELAVIRQKIQDQMDKIIHNKPVRSQQMLNDYKEIYNAQYMTNLCFVLGMGLILWYIVRSNTNARSQLPEPTEIQISTYIPTQ